MPGMGKAAGDTGVDEEVIGILEAAGQGVVDAQDSSSFVEERGQNVGQGDQVGLGLRVGGQGGLEQDGELVE